MGTLSRAKPLPYKRIPVNVAETGAVSRCQERIRLRIAAVVI